MIGARYGFTPLSLPAPDGERRFAVHAFEGVLAWGFGDAMPLGTRHLERAVPFELSIPFGVLVDPGSPGHRVAFVAGLDLRLLFHL